MVQLYVCRAYCTSYNPARDFTNDFQRYNPTQPLKHTTNTSPYTKTLHYAQPCVLNYDASNGGRFILFPSNASRILMTASNKLWKMYERLDYKLMINIITFGYRKLINVTSLQNYTKQKLSFSTTLEGSVTKLQDRCQITATRIMIKRGNYL